MPDVSLPSAIRMPISRVRWVTWYASTPYNPTDASSSATTPNASDSTIGARRGLRDFSTRSDIVKTSKACISGSISASTRCTEAVVAAPRLGS